MSQFSGFAPEELQGKPRAQSPWAADQVIQAARASRHLRMDVQVSFSGVSAWPYLYPSPQRPDGLIKEAFDELAYLWRPILNAHKTSGVDYAFDLHPGEGLMDGVSFERFLDAVGGHSRIGMNYDPSHFLLQQMDYLGSGPFAFRPMP